MTTSALQVVVAHNAKELASHLEAWDDLASHAIEPNVFYESWHLLPALRVFDEGNSHFVLIYANQPQQGPVLCGFFPLQQHNRYKGVPVHVLTLWDHDYCSLCTPLVRVGHEIECLTAFFRWFNTGSGATLLEMAAVRADGPFQRLWVELLHRSGALSFTDIIHTRALLQPSSNDAEEYLHSALSRKRRKELKRLENRLGEMGPLHYEVVEEHAVARGIEEFLQLEASGWKGAQGTAFASKDSHRAFFREIIMAAADRGRLMLLALRLNGRPVAMKLNLRAAEGAFAWKIAYDEEHARFSPGVLLELDNIRRLHENSALKWMDSCTIPDHVMINRLWTERRIIQSSVLSSGKISGDLVVSLLPLMRFVKRRLKRTSSATATNPKGEEP